MLNILLNETTNKTKKIIIISIKYVYRQSFFFNVPFNRLSKCLNAHVCVFVFVGLSPRRMAGGFWTLQQIYTRWKYVIINTLRSSSVFTVSDTNGPHKLRGLFCIGRRLHTHTHTSPYVCARVCLWYAKLLCDVPTRACVRACASYEILNNLYPLEFGCGLYAYGISPTNKKTNLFAMPPHDAFGVTHTIALTATAAATRHKSKRTWNGITLQNTLESSLSDAIVFAITWRIALSRGPGSTIRVPETV